MYGLVTDPTPIRLAAPARDKLRRFINAYWLRPENAMWMFLRSEALNQVPIAGPSIDLGCGDGVFSFLHAGGAFDPDFDVFAALNLATDETPRDMFDHVDERYAPRIAREPAFRFDCGTDLKQNLLVKAQQLRFYGDLRRHDNNQPLPFDAETFATVYCNTAYWVDRIGCFLNEMKRITQSGGSVVLHVKLDDIRRCTFTRQREMLGDDWLELIQRDRFSSWPTLADRATWEQRFDNAGLEIVSAAPFVNATHAHIWNVGLRPIAPLLIRAMNAVLPHLRREIKHDWVDMFCQLLEPFSRPDADFFDEPSHPVELQYILTPRH